MKINELEEKINLLELAEKKGYRLKKAGSGVYRIEPCPICGHSGHFTIYEKNNNYCSFSKCCTGGKAYKFLQEVCGLDPDQAYRELFELAGEPSNYKKNAFQNKQEGYQRQKKRTNIGNNPGKNPGKVSGLKQKKRDFRGGEKPKEPGQNSHKNIYGNTPKNVPDSQENVIKRNLTELIEKIYQKQTKEDLDYFLKREIPLELIKKYKLCISNNKGQKSAILPIWKGPEIVAYTKRILTENGNTKYLNSKGEIPLFNADYFGKKTLMEVYEHEKAIRKKNDKNEDIAEIEEDILHQELLFVTEGIFDALSLEAIGEKAISLGGVNHLGKLLKMLKENKYIQKKYRFVTAFDNDEAGKNAYREMLAFDKTVKKLEIPEKYKDINSWHVVDPEEFKKNVMYQKANIIIPGNQRCWTFKLKKRIDLTKESKKIKTGFPILDTALNGLLPAIYILGGQTGVGKTTFAHQICEQIAIKGKLSIIFSLEMDNCHFLTKSYSRQGFLINSKKSISSTDILCGKTNETVEKGAKKFFEFAEKIQIFETSASEQTLEYMEKQIKNCMKNTGERPFVVVDYLQIMPAPEEKFSYSEKQKIDKNIEGLKKLSRKLRVTIFLISSLNRSSYSNSIGAEAFKESGNIEYSADVLLGFQLGIIETNEFKEAGSEHQKKMISDALIEAPREIIVTCLKNRHGIGSWQCFFDYYSAFDTFKQKPFSTCGNSPYEPTQLNF